MNKKWYHSKTLWVNGIAALAIIVQAITGQEWLDAEAQTAIIVVVNLILRVITSQPISLK